MNRFKLNYKIILITTILLIFSIYIILFYNKKKDDNSQLLLINTSFSQQLSDIMIIEDTDIVSNKKISIGNATCPFFYNNYLFLADDRSDKLCIYNIKDNDLLQQNIHINPVDIYVDKETTCILYNSNIKNGTLSINNKNIILDGVVTCMQKIDDNIYVRADKYNSSFRLEKSILYVVSCKSLKIKDKIILKKTNRSFALGVYKDYLIMGNCYDPESDFYYIEYYDIKNNQTKNIKFNNNVNLGNTIRIQGVEDKLYLFQRPSKVIVLNNNFELIEECNTDDYLIDGIYDDGDIYFSTKNLENQTFNIFKINENSRDIISLNWDKNVKLDLVPYKFIKI